MITVTSVLHTTITFSTECSISLPVSRVQWCSPVTTVMLSAFALNKKKKFWLRLGGVATSFYSGHGVKLIQYCNVQGQFEFFITILWNNKIFRPITPFHLGQFELPWITYEYYQATIFSNWEHQFKSTLKLIWNSSALPHIQKVFISRKICHFRYLRELIIKTS